MSSIQQFKANLRQLLFPSEFRISELPWSPDLLQGVRDLLQASTKTSPETPPPEPNPPSPTIHNRLLADIGTGLWRLRLKMTEPGTQRPLEPMRKSFRHLESTWDAMNEAGIVIRDHTGEPVPVGGIYGLKVVASQPTPGIQRPRVEETIKPSIFWGDQVLQIGEVIVAIPLDDNDDNAASGK